MTEQSFPFGGTAVADAPAPVLPSSYDDDTDSSNNQKLKVIGAVVAVLVLLVAAFMLLKGGGSSNDVAGFPPPHGTPSGTTTGTQAGATPAQKPVHLPKNYKGKVGRDPFKALVTEQAAATAPAAGSTATAPTTDTTVPTTSTTTPTDTSTSTTTTTSTTPKTPTYRPVWIRLTNITNNGAKFDVGFSNHKSLRVVDYWVKAPGSAPKIFAKNFALLRISNGVAFLQFGDGSPFKLDMQHNVMIVN